MRDDKNIDCLAGLPRRLSHRFATTIGRALGACQRSRRSAGGLHRQSRRRDGGRAGVLAID